MSEDIGKLFDEVAGGYDEGLRRTVPCFEELYGAVLGLIPLGRSSFRVLDLGSGTGILAAMMGKVFPEAGITLADASNEMTNLARNRLADEPNGKFTFLLMDYVREPVPGRYDVVVSALSLHHVADEDKRKVFRKVYDSLEEGGIFINADQLHRAGAETGHHGAHQTHHGEAGEGDAAVGDHVASSVKTHETPLEEQLAWMRDAGFTAVERTYENGRFAVLAGRKNSA